jgi:hypothetical protein
VPGLQLSRGYWSDVVAPILDPHVPASARAAALLYTGSDVLGFDTEQSTDHGWGPRLFVFLPDSVSRARVRELVEASTRVAGTYRLSDASRGTEWAVPSGLVAHRRRVHAAVLGSIHAVSMRDWLRPTQLLRARRAKCSNGTGDLARRPAVVDPEDVWRYVLACQRNRPLRKRRSSDDPAGRRRARVAVVRPGSCAI